MTSITRADEWQEFADATLDHRPEAGRMGRELAAATPPVALAARARHRRPAQWRPLLPLWLGALLLAFQALHEMDAATASQLAESAQAGAM